MPETIEAPDANPGIVTALRAAAMLAADLRPEDVAALFRIAADFIEAMETADEDRPALNAGMIVDGG